MADHTDYLPNVASYHDSVDDVDEAAVKGIVRHLGIALRSRDASLVSSSDPAELARVRDGFLKKKLALTLSEAELDAAVKEVAETMKGAKWDTVLGPISYDKKGDITTVDYVFYKWGKDGKYDEIPVGKGS